MVRKDFFFFFVVPALTFSTPSSVNIIVDKLLFLICTNVISFAIYVGFMRALLHVYV